MKHGFRHSSRLCCLVCAIGFTLFGMGARGSAQDAPSKQDTPATPAFEVATIKPAAPFDPTKFGPRISATRASYTDETLRLLIANAYHVRLPQVSGPKWIDSDQFDIVATIPEGAARDDVDKMLQALLKDRFKLTFHIEKRDAETYALVVGKNGANLKPSPPDPAEIDVNEPLKAGETYVGEGNTKSKMVRNTDGSSTIFMGKRGTQTVKSDIESRTMHIETSKMTMQELAGRLPGFMGAGSLEKYTVVDETGLKGTYQVAIDYPLPDFSRPKIPAAGGDISDAIPSDPQDGGVLTRSLDALGLKLEKRKAPIDVYVIDRIEKPSEN